MSRGKAISDKCRLKPLFAALRDYDENVVRAKLDESFDVKAKIKLAYPFEDLDGPTEFFSNALTPLSLAFPDLERRGTIAMAGPDALSETWVGCCGYYTGTFARPFLDIPPTGHMASMRFHEFYRIEDGRIIEMQALWDIPELMVQAGAWPLSPSLGREWHVPGPTTQDGMTDDPREAFRSTSSLTLVRDMLVHLGKFATDGVEGMRLDHFWHPRCSWYGPSGIGTCRGISGFRNWHQIPFLNGMPDRVGSEDAGHLFADNDYVGFTAWPGMQMTISGDGFLGIAPSGQKITMRSLDFWRCENGLIRENWVLVDLLHVYAQIGVNVLGRMREFNKARSAPCVKGSAA